MYKRIRALLEGEGIMVVGTRQQNEKPSFTKRANISNGIKADLLIYIYGNAVGRG